MERLLVVVMNKVNNKKIISTISKKSLKSNKIRNIITILAIALTTIMFTSIFTILFSINHAFQLSNFKQVGGYSHASLKYVNENIIEDIKNDNSIKEYGLRKILGVASNKEFSKNPVEVSYMDKNLMKWSFVEIENGSYPKEGTNEAVTDIETLSLLGIKPEIGKEFTIEIDVDQQKIKQTFTLSGYYHSDKNIVAHQLLLPKSAVNEIIVNIKDSTNDKLGTWNMDIMFDSSVNIPSKLENLLNNYNYQNSDSTKDNFIHTGINWAYTSTQIYNNLDPLALIFLILLLFIIMLTGYLIINNIFRISIINDTKFLGLLKTIGTTPKQIKTIVRKQALYLSLVAIPLGITLGYLVGIILTPILLKSFNKNISSFNSFNPIIFIGSSLFALFTVFISTAKPAKIASKITPIEASKFTDYKINKSYKKTTKKLSSLSMAILNIKRNLYKSVVTILSLSMAILLLNLTFTFTNGFDMDKYLRNVVVDYQIADSSYFNNSKLWNNNGVEETVIEDINKNFSNISSGAAYGSMNNSIYQFVNKEIFINNHKNTYDPSHLETFLKESYSKEYEKFQDNVLLLGMDDFILNKVNLIDGNLDELKDPNAKKIAAIYKTDDYNNLLENSHFAKVGDKITFRYVYEKEYIDTNTGKVYKDLKDIPEQASIKKHLTKYKDINYEVCAIVTLPYNLGYRFSSFNPYLLSSKNYLKDTKNNNILYYAFDKNDNSSNMESFMEKYTTEINSIYDYESKLTYEKDFESFRNTFIILGSTLSFIIGLIGILNFLNVTITSIISRRKEFAILQAIGMTGKQLKNNLIIEGVFYTFSSLSICVIFTLILSPFIGKSFNNIFWFFSYKFTILPIFICAPFMILISILVPLVCYKLFIKQSIVNRLR